MEGIKLVFKKEFFIKEKIISEQKEKLRKKDEDIVAKNMLIEKKELEIKKKDKELMEQKKELEKKDYQNKLLIKQLIKMGMDEKEINILLKANNK